jgi:hypothetical protein
LRVALAFFGLPRCSQAAFGSIEENLIAPLARCASLEVRYHFYRQDRVVNRRSRENHLLDPANYTPFMQFEGVLEDPLPRIEALPLDPIKSHGDAWGDRFRSLRNLLLQLHSLQEVTALAAALQPDVVVFARPDQIYHDAIAPIQVEQAALSPRTIALPSWQWWYGGYNDRFAISGHDAAPGYGNRLALAERFCRELERPLHAEQLLHFAVRHHRLQVVPIALRASRVRVTGRVEHESFDPAPEALQILEALRPAPGRSQAGLGPLGGQ